MKHTLRRIKVALAAVFAVAILGVAPQAQAAELPLAGASQLAGVTFDDLPFLLPVEVNFRMAMLAVSSELGRSCGKMEAYGWHMSQSEQNRVNQIFNSTIEKLRAQGYVASPESVKAASKDITVFTADRPNRHLMFLWSASDLGLVLNICETSVPISPTHRPTSIPPSVQVFPMPMDILPVPQEVSVGPASHGKVAVKAKNKKGAKASAAKPVVEEFSPVGKWTGNYTCEQGVTGGTLEVQVLKGKNFEGLFRFYPTDKNPSIPRGSYTVYGQYDKDSKRILINPGEWITRPKNFYNTVIVGSFDPARNAFSAYFEGVDGCTSFEARKDNAGGFTVEKKKKAPVKHVVKKKKIKKTLPTIGETGESAPAASAQSTVVPMDDKKAGGIDLTPKAAVPAIPAPVSTSAPDVPATAAPVSTSAPGVPATTVPLVAKPAPVSTASPAATSNPVSLVAKPAPIPAIPAPAAAPASTAKSAAVPVVAPKPETSADEVPFVPSEFMAPAPTGK